MANGHLKNCSTRLIIIEIIMEIKTRYNHTAIRMAIIKIYTNKKWRWGCGEKGTLYTVGGNVNDADTA